MYVYIYKIYVNVNIYIYIYMFFVNYQFLRRSSFNMFSRVLTTSGTDPFPQTSIGPFVDPVSHDSDSTETN